MYSTYSDPSLYYSYPTTTTASTASTSSLIATILGFGIAFWVIFIAIAIVVIIARWKMFKKANIGGWESLIPIHSDIVEMQLGGIETYWYFLNLVPFVGAIILAFWKSIALAKSFGKGTGFGILMVFFPFICYPILGFGKAEYVGSKTN